MSEEELPNKQPFLVNLPARSPLRTFKKKNHPHKKNITKLNYIFGNILKLNNSIKPQKLYIADRV